MATAAQIGIGAAVGKGTATSTYAGTTGLPRRRHDRHGPGPVAVTATSGTSIDTEIQGGTVGLVAYGSLSATSTLGGLTQAFVAGTPTRSAPPNST